MSTAHRKRGPGFQGSHTTRVEVTIYKTTNEDPIVFYSDNEDIPFNAKDDREAFGYSLINCSTSKTLNQPAGQFSFEFKSAGTRGRSTGHEFKTIVDDAWVDIVYIINNERFHKMRGTIDSVSRHRTGKSNTETWSVTGRDHGKVFDLTPIWFNRYTAENIGGGYSYHARKITGDIIGSPAKMVQAFLFGFLDILDDKGRATWQLPPNMPLSISGKHFVDAVIYSDKYFTNEPKRIAITPNFATPEGTTLWAVAQEWSDPMFCDVICDLFHGEIGNPTYSQPARSARPYGGELQTLLPEWSVLGVMFRDKPFPTFEAPGGLDNSPWFTEIPIFEIAQQDISTERVSRNGHERKNAYFVSSQQQANLGHAAQELVNPIWDREDIAVHGLRRMDVLSKYKGSIADGNDDILLAATLRKKLRDWHCLNPYFLSGTISLSHGRPDMRVGTRLRVLSSDSPNDDEDYYIEGLSDSWSYRPGLKTQITLTRGWIGGDDDLKEALTHVRKRYGQDPIPATPGGD